MSIIVECSGLPVPGFPVHKVNPDIDGQIVYVPYIRIRGVTYASGAYVELEKTGDNRFEIMGVGIQPHLINPLRHSRHNDGVGNGIV